MRRAPSYGQAGLAGFRTHVSLEPSALGGLVPGSSHSEMKPQAVGYG